MAGGNMGGLEMSLTLRSTVEKQLEKISGSITEASKKYEKLKEMLNKGLDVNGNPTTRTAKQTKELKDKVNDAEKEVKSLGSSFKSAEGRAEKLFKVCDQLDKVFETMGKNTDLAKSLHLGSAISQISDLELSIRAMRGEWINFLTSTAGASQLSNGIGFTTTINGWKRELSGYEKELGGIYDNINVQSKQSENLRKQGAKEAAKADEQAIKDELKAEQYYVTRKQRVEDAIQAMYDRRAKLAERMKSAPDFQKGQLQGVVEAINQVIARLSKAKETYEEVQTLQAKGLPPDLIRAKTGAGNKTETYLGRYTGMSELFGGDIKKGQLPYNYVTSLYREVMDKTATPFSFKDRITNNKANAQMLVRGDKEVEKAEKDSTASFVAQQKQIDRTIERYRDLTQVVRSAMEQIRNYRTRGMDYSSLLGKLQPVQSMRHDLRNALKGQGYSFNLYDSGTARNQIKDLQDLTREYERNATSAQKDADAKKKADITNQHDNISTEIRGRKELEQQEKKNADAVAKTQEQYAKLSRVLHDAWSERSRSRGLGIDTKELERSLPHVIELWRELHASMALGVGTNNYANKGNDKVSVDELQRLVSEQKSLNAEKERTNKLDDKQADRDSAQSTRQLGQAAQTELNRQQRIIDMRNREDKALDDTTKRYIQLYDVLKSLQSVRSDRLGLGGDVTKLDSAISNLLPKVRELHDAAYSGRAARTLYNSAASQRDIDLAKQLASDEAKVNKELEKQVELSKQREAANEAANRKTAANAQKGIDQQEKQHERSLIAEQKQIDNTIERYAKLRAMLSEGLAVRRDSNFLGVNTDRFTEKLQSLASKVLELRRAYNAGTYSSDLFDKGKDKVELDDVKELIKAYKDLNKEKSKEISGKVFDQVNLKTGGIDTSVFEKGLAQAKQLKEVYEQLEYYKPKLQYAWLDLESSRKFGNANNPDMRHMEDEVSRLEAKVKDLQTTFETLGGNTRLANVDNEIKGLEEAIDRLKNSAKETDLGKLLGLKNNVSTDWFAEEKRAAQAQEAHLAKEQEITAAFEAEARNVQKVNDLLEMRAHKAQMEASRPNLYQEGINTHNTNVREAQTAVVRSQEEAQQIEHTRELARLKEDIIRRSNQEVEALRMQNNAARDLASAFDHVHSSASKSSQVISDIKSLFFQGGIVFGAQQLFNELVRTGGEIVQQHVALQTIVGDLQDANQLFGQIQDLALRSPFTFGELNRDVKQLAAFGVETDQLYDKTRRLADISSGLGVSFERLGLAYGQVKARSWLDGKELRQFAYAGLPMLQKLADYYSKTRGGAYTTSQVRDMITKRQVSFEDVDAIFDELTDKGGQFYNVQDKLSQTLLGRYMKLKDAWDIMLSGFADGQTITGKFFSFVLDRVTDLIQAFDKIGPVIAAAFSGYAAKRLLTTFGGRAGADIIAAKQSLAAKLQEKSLTDQLSAAEMRIVQTKNKITAEDLQNESILRQINQQEVRRLFITGQITKAQYQQLMSSNILGTNSKNLLRTLAQGSLLFQNAGNWGARLGATIGLIGGGLKTLGKSLWGMIGGLPGLLITGVSMGVAYLWQQHEELTQAQKRAQEELSDRGKQMVDFLKDYNINDIIAKGSDAIDNAIEAYKDKLKEIAPYNYDAYMMTANEKKSHEERLRYLSEQLELLKQANNLANNNSSKFVDETRGSFEDALKDLRGKIKANGTFSGTLADPLTGTSLEDRYGSELDKEMQNLADKIAKVLPNIGKDPKVTEAAKQLMSNMMAQLSFSPQEELYFRVKLGKLLHIPGSENALADEARARLQKLIQTAKVTLSNGVTETGEQLSYKIRYGQKLSKAEENKLNELYDQALAQLKRDFPSYASELQTLLNNANFRANIRLNFIGGEAPSEYEKQIMSHVPSIVSEKIRDKVSEWSKLGSYEGNNKAKSEIDTAYNNMIADQQKVKKGKITQKVADVSKQEYEDLLTAANYFGYDYLGEKKKSNKPPKADHSAERAREKAEREFMRARQKEESSIQAYYDTWDKWRKVEGDAAARNRVANDSRFSKDFRNKYSDPEQLASNYEKLAKSIAQTTDERKQFVQELKSKAAEKEAQQEYEEAVRLNNIFKEQLDSLSKRYELYQRLSKVAGSDVAGRFAFGSQHHSKSYYSYLTERLQAMQQRDVKDFVKNGGVAENIPDVKISANAKKVDFSKHGGLEGVMEMPDEDVLSEYGTNVSNLIKALKAERDKLDLSIADSLEQGFSYYQDYNKELDSINQKYDEQIKRLQQRNKLDKESKDYLDDKSLAQQTTILNQQKEREVAGVNWKSFQNSDTYRKFFGTTLLLGSKDAEKYSKTIREKVTEAFTSGSLTADEYASKIEEINKAMNDVRNNRSDMFTYLFGGGIDGLTQKKYNQGKQQADYYSWKYSKYLRQFQEAQAKGDEGSMEKAKQAMSESQSMIDAGNNMMQGASKAASTVAIIDKIVNGINDNVQKLKALMDDIANSIEVFSGSEHADNFRNSAGYTFVSGFSNASQGATDAWNSLKSGNVMGVVEGGFRSIIGWATPWAQRHDAKLQKQIETAERTNKLIDSMRNSIERRLSNSLGGVYGYTSNKRDTQKIKDGLDNYSLAKTGARYGRNTIAQSSGMGALGGAALGLGTAVGMGAIGGAMGGLGAGVGAGAAIGGVAGPIGAAIGAAVGAIFGGLFGHRRKKHTTNYTEDTYESMVRANQTQAYYDQMLASYKMQRDNLDAQMKAEEKKKNKDKDKINDYKSQLDELDDKIHTFAKDMAKSLYDIDVKSWAKELTDSVVSAWAAGEDAVEAYRNKVKDLMKTLSTNIISQKIMEVALKPVEDYIEKVMGDQSGILNEGNIVAIADMLDKIGDTTIPSIIDLLERLREKGVDLSDTNSASMSSSIKGISEATADLLASYANASRADISVIRQQLGITLPEFNLTAQAQLQQLNAIAQNTLRNADAAESIQNSIIEVVSILNASRNESRPLSVKVK